MKYIFFIQLGTDKVRGNQMLEECKRPEKIIIVCIYNAMS